MVSHTNLREIQTEIKKRLKSGDLELVVIPRLEYETLLGKMEDLQDIADSREALNQYQSGKGISFEAYDSRRRKGRISY